MPWRVATSPVRRDNVERDPVASRDQVELPVLQVRIAVRVRVPVVLDVVGQHPLPVDRVQEQLPAALQGVGDGLQHPHVLVLRLEVAERREHVDDRVELVGERDATHVPVNGLDLDPFTAGTLPRHPQVVLVQVLARDDHATLGQRDGVTPVPAREIQHAVALLQSQRFHDERRFTLRRRLRQPFAVDLRVVFVEELGVPVGANMCHVDTSWAF